jgi:hypothetical protein
MVREPFPLRVNEGEWGVIGGVGYRWRSNGRGGRRT